MLALAGGPRQWDLVDKQPWALLAEDCLLLFVPPTFGGAGPHLQLTYQ